MMKSKLFLGLIALGFITHSCSVEEMKSVDQTAFYELKTSEITEKNDLQGVKDSLDIPPKEGGDIVPPGD